MAGMEQELKERMKRLGVDVIRMVEHLPRQPAADVVGRQIMRSATSIGANYWAACRARSMADFIAKLAIAEEESDEMMYWLEILQELRLLDGQSFKPLHTEAEEITKILTASGKTAKQNKVREQLSPYTNPKSTLQDPNCL